MDLQTASAIFNLPPAASLEDVKERYRPLAKQLHPDVSHPQDARQFVLLTTAYSFIREERRGRDKNRQTEEPSLTTEESVSASIIQEHVDERFARPSLRPRCSLLAINLSTSASRKRRTRFRAPWREHGNWDCCPG